MRRNFTIALAVCLLLGGPFFVSALTIGEVQAQIQQLLANIAELTQQRTVLQGQNTSTVIIDPGVSRHRVCSALYRNLALGTRGEDVFALQEFLRTEGYFFANATGYFGPITAQALARWQADHGIAAVGILGPLTRERIRMWCGGPTPPPPVCTKEYRPVCGAKPIVCITTPCNPIQHTYSNLCEMRRDSATFLYDGACRDTYPVNRPPVISGFSGPTTLSANQTGTWTINASDPENGQLTYSITWGDEAYAVPMASMAARETFVQTTAFTHAYASSGTYTITTVVRDSSGQEARSTTTVRIGESPTYCTLEYNPVCGQKTVCPACYYSEPACLAPCYTEQKTYSNRCFMAADGATFLYSGACAPGTM